MIFHSSAFSIKMKAFVVFLVLASFVALCAADYTDDEKQIFKDWCKAHNKKYRSHEEEQTAMKKVLESKKNIDEHNKNYEAGKVSFMQRLWEHSDLSTEEKHKHLTGLKDPNEGKPDRARRAAAAYPQFPPGPPAVDWTQRGLVGPVENQGQCSSCYTFSTAAIVNAVIRKRGDGTDLVSPQQLVDCARNNPGGCGGGWPEISLEYVKQNGMTDEYRYPYVAYPRTCEYNQNIAVVPPNFIKDIYSIPTRGNETWLKDIVGSVGPVSIALCDEESFQNYGGGVYIQDNCCTALRHAPVITGYGTDPVWGDYWIVKNSWGTSWGINGYAKFARNRNNMCNIAFYAVYAT